MYIYSEKSIYFAQHAPDMEEITMQELIQLGAQNLSKGYLGWHFQADPATLYKINYCSRFLIRVLAPLVEFPCNNPDEIYENARPVEWLDFLSTKDTFAIFSTVANSNITHSQYASLRLKDAIADYFYSDFQERPSVDTENPDIWFCLHIENNQAVISMDTSGGSLHRRGYRKVALAAPIQETLAAAIVHLSGWDGQTPLYDFMCGSGTLLCEALMHYCKIPAGYLRSNFGFQHAPDFKSKVWEEVKKTCDQDIRPIPPNMIAGSDIDPNATQIALNNIQKLPYGNTVEITTCDFATIQDLSNRTIVSNPPYGIRLETDVELPIFYEQLGDFLKQRCKNSTAYLYFGDRQWLKSVGLHPNLKIPLSNGGLDGRLAKFELY